MKIKYERIEECKNLRSWIFFSWSFWTASSKRLIHETGYRIFGWVFYWERKKK